MKRSSLLGFVFLNVVVTFATVFAAIGFLQRFSPQPTPRPVAPPLVVVVTSTPDPKGTQVAYIVVTATHDPSQANTNEGSSSDTTSTLSPSNNPNSNPDSIVTDAAAGGVSGGNSSSSNLSGSAVPTVNLGNIPTLDPSLLPPSIGAIGTASADGTDSADSGCQEYAIKKGDTAGNVAQTFGVSLADLMQANKLKEADLARLQIGQKLIIPLNGCGLATDEPTPTDTPTKFELPTLPPTSTIAPTAANAQIEVVQVINPGDITSEGVEIRNISGGVIQMKNWTLSDANGLKFTFPDYRMFPGGRVTVYTKNGTNTPIVLYWGQSRAIWGQPNETAIITDDKGQVQGTYSLSGGNSIGLEPGKSPDGSIPTPTP